MNILVLRFSRMSLVPKKKHISVSCGSKGEESEASVTVCLSLFEEDESTIQDLCFDLHEGEREELPETLLNLKEERIPTKKEVMTELVPVIKLESYCTDLRCKGEIDDKGRR